MAAEPPVEIRSSSFSAFFPPSQRTTNDFAHGGNVNHRSPTASQPSLAVSDARGDKNNVGVREEKKTRGKERAKNNGGEEEGGQKERNGLAQEGKEKGKGGERTRGGAQNAAGRKLYTTEMEFPINFGLGGPKSSSSPSSSAARTRTAASITGGAVCRTELLSAPSSRAIRCFPPRDEEENDVGVEGNPGGGEKRRAAGIKAVER